MNVLAVDVGGTHVKILASGQREASRVPLRADPDGPTDGPRGQGTGRGLEV